MRGPSQNWGDVLGHLKHPTQLGSVRLVVAAENSTQCTTVESRLVPADEISQFSGRKMIRLICQMFLGQQR